MSWSAPHQHPFPSCLAPSGFISTGKWHYGLHFELSAGGCDCALSQSRLLTIFDNAVRQISNEGSAGKDKAQTAPAGTASPPPQTARSSLQVPTASRTASEPVPNLQSVPVPNIVIETLLDDAARAEYGSTSSMAPLHPRTIPTSVERKSDRDEASEPIGLSSDSDESRLSMYDEIDELTNLKPWEGEEPKFAPEHTLSDLFKASSAGPLKDLLKKRFRDAGTSLDDDRLSELVKFVCHKAPKIFATLVFLDGEHLILRFLDNGFDDRLLPVVKNGSLTLVSFSANAEVKLLSEAVQLANEKASRIKSTNPVMVQVKNRARDEAQKLRDRVGEAQKAAECADAKVKEIFDLPNQQQRRVVNKFSDDYQWRFTAPVFTTDRFDYIFADKTVMPFWPSVKTRNGPFSSVEQRQAHRNHLSLITVSPSPWYHCTAMSSENPLMERKVMD